MDYSNRCFLTLAAHCSHMDTVTKHPVPVRVKPLFVIF